MTASLEGIRVVDFGQYIAGPLTGMLLADQGADVIKVDPPTGPMWDTPANATWNRGKRAISLDLKSASDVAVAMHLIASADVVIENFRPGVMDRLGLGFATVTAENPAIIYGSLPGFAADDARAEVRGFEGIVGAAAATYPPNGAVDPDRPVYTAIPMASTYAAIHAAVAIANAIYARGRDGLGQHIETALFDCMYAAIGQRGLRRHKLEVEPHLPANIWSGNFRCKDGRWVRFGGSFNSNFGEFVALAGIGKWPADLLDFTKLLEDPELSAEQQRRARELFLTRTAAEWEDLIAAAGSEGTVIRTSEEWLTHPHSRASGMVIEVDDPRCGKMLQPGVSVGLSRTPGAVRSPAPRPDQHRDEILAECQAQLPRQPITPVVSDIARSALDGVKVLDLCIVLAGPTVGRTLAEYGADVIKIDPPYRGAEVSNLPEVMNHCETARGKRHILLDLKSESGREVFLRLVDEADVVVQNFRSGKLEKLGLGYDDLRKRKPSIIYASMNAYGPTGPWAGRPGHESFVQATTGMSDRFGGDADPRGQPNVINDYGTGFLGAFAVALALIHRARTGEGQHVNASLASTSLVLQSWCMQQFSGKTWDEPRGQEALGEGPLQRAYRAADTWVFVGATDKDLDRMDSVEGLAGIKDYTGEALAAELQRRFPSAEGEAWVRRLRQADIGAHRVVFEVTELMDDPRAVERGLSITREFDDIGLVTACGPATRLSRTPVRGGHASPRPGKHAREILEEIGWGSRYERLLAEGVIRIDGVTAG